jgi:hypothetical protein
VRTIAATHAAAWNLAIDSTDEGRLEEATEWRWRAAFGGDELAMMHLANEATDDDR